MISLVMVIAGLLVWYLAELPTERASNLLTALGVFLFVYGASSMNATPEWCNLSPRKKAIKIAVASVLGIAVAAGIALLIGRG